jgi:Zn-dependent protease
MDIHGFLMGLLIRAPGILIGITVHEYAHGLVALWRGDATAKQAGRLSLNPLAHLDVFGTLMLLFGPFGWAKPVPVNFHNLNKPKRDMILVAVAGPVSNILCAALIGISIRFYSPFLSDSMNTQYIFIILKTAFIINIGLSFFNLLPIPPLDGSNILMGFLPNTRIPDYLRFMRHLPMVFLVLIFLQWGFHIPILNWILDPLFMPYFNFWQFIIFGGKVI